MVKNQEESSLPVVNVCFSSKGMSFQSLENLEKKCEKKIEHFVSLNKICDVTTGFAFIQYLNPM